MSATKIISLFPILCGTLLLSGCPGDDTSASTDTDASSTGSTGADDDDDGPVSDTPGVDTTNNVDSSGSTTEPITDDSTSTTDTPATGTETGPGTDTGTETGPGTDTGTETGPGTDTGTETGPGTDTGTSTDVGTDTGTDTGLPPGEGFGDCVNNPEAVACTAEEVCITGPNVGFCGLTPCDDAGDCPAPPPGGNAPVICATFDIMACAIDCSAGQTCPDDMICFAGFCAWELEAGGGGLCPDLDAGTTVPQTINGDNTGLFDDHIASCGDGGGEEEYVQFTATDAGFYTFDTAGSASDTILFVLDGCDGPELGCNDDAVGLTSSVSVDLEADQTVIIGVDGFGGETGPFTLNISFVGDLNECCFVQPGPLCGDAALEDCVCAFDDFCCLTQWDDICVGEAQSDCGLAC